MDRDYVTQVECEKRTSDHESRIRELERTRWRNAGITIGVTALGSGVGAFLAALQAFSMLKP